MSVVGCSSSSSDDAAGVATDGTAEIPDITDAATPDVAEDAGEGAADDRAPAEVLEALPEDFPGFGPTFSDDVTAQFTSSDLDYTVTVTVTEGTGGGSSVLYSVPVAGE